MENIKRLHGGNINGISWISVKEILQNGKPISRAGLYMDAGDILHNPTSEKISLKESYSTVANGRSDEIYIPAFGYLKMVSKGSSYAFAVYEIWD